MYKRTAKLEYSLLAQLHGLAYMPENFFENLAHAHANPLMDNDQPNVQYPAAAGATCFTGSHLRHAPQTPAPARPCSGMVT
jgi:hypothetical protein